MSTPPRLPREWVALRSNTTGKVYYYSRRTHESTWTPPTAQSSSGERRMSRRDRRHRAAAERSMSRTPPPVVRRRTPSPQPSLLCSHVLIKHKESRRPFDWQNKSVTRTKEEALQFATELRQDIVNDRITFEDAARGYSECTSAKNNGDIGVFTKGQMQIEFENAAFALEVGQVSEIVESNSGYHIIMRRD